MHECAATAHSCTAFYRRPRGTERPAALIQMARTLLCLARLCHCESFVCICHASPPSLIPKSPARMPGPTHSIHSAGALHPVHHNRRCMAHRHRTQAPAVSSSPPSRPLRRRSSSKTISAIATRSSCISMATRCSWPAASVSASRSGISCARRRTIRLRSCSLLTSAHSWFACRASRSTRACFRRFRFARRVFPAIPASVTCFPDFSRRWRRASNRLGRTSFARWNWRSPNSWSRVSRATNTKAYLAD